MRAAVLLVLAGCYRPNGEAACSIECTSSASCPAHLACRSGWCQDPNGPACALDDGGLVIDQDGVQFMDAPLPTLCPQPMVHGTETAIVAGEWFGARLAPERYAIKFNFELDAMSNLIGVIRGTRDDVINTNPSYAVAITDDPSSLYRAPRLAPSGMEMYMRKDPTMTVGFSQIARSTRTPGSDTWTVPAPITIASPLISTDDLPSPPTETSPRRMVLTRSMGFSELREISIGSWVVERTQTDMTFQTPTAETVVFLGEAHLTEDGKRFVFRGQIPQQLVQAFYLERAVLTAPFTSPARILPTLGSVNQPFWTPECKYLFYTRLGEDQIYRVVYP